jgi:hypothetical protein
MGTSISLNARGTASLVLNTAPLAAAAIPAAVTEGVSGSGTVANIRRGRKNLTNHRRWRIVARISTASSASAKASFQWSLDQTTWVWSDGTASGSAPGADAYVSMAATVTLSSNWIPIPAAARTDVWVRTVTLDGDGATTGSIALFVIETE